MDKKKISAFEFAIMQIADPEEAKNFQPFTEGERFQMRIENIRRQEERLLKTTKDKTKQNG